MIERDKLFIVAGNIDDSIKAVTPVYDITIFPNFLQFAEYIEHTPDSVNTIIISEKELAFTSSNMSRLIEVLGTVFLELTGKCIYCIGPDTNRKVVEQFLDTNDVENIICYQGDLSQRYLSDVITGAARNADENETELVTYRMRASEYVSTRGIQMYESDEDEYETDEKHLSDVPEIEEPEITIPSIDILTNIYYVVGKNSLERSLFAFIEAQYLALTGKTIIMESDKNFHILTDMVKKSNVTYEYIDIEEFNTNCSTVLNQIKDSGSRLIVLGCVNRIDFDYDFIFDLLVSNLAGFIDYFVRECSFSQTPYGSYYNIVCGDTVPEILECVSSLKYNVDADKCLFVGVRTRDMGEINVSSGDFTDMVQILLGQDKLRAEVIQASGINLKGEEVIYDLLGVIGRGNERQS